MMNLSQKEVTYPFLQISFNENGIVLTKVTSSFSSETTLIPVVNADAMTATWLASRPDDVFKQALQIRREAKAQKETIDHALANVRLKA